MTTKELLIFCGNCRVMSCCKRTGVGRLNLYMCVFKVTLNIFGNDWPANNWVHVRKVTTQAKKATLTNIRALHLHETQQLKCSLHPDKGISNPCFHLEPSTVSWHKCGEHLAVIVKYFSHGPLNPLCWDWCTLAYKAFVTVNLTHPSKVIPMHHKGQASL